MPTTTARTASPTRPTTARPTGNVATVSINVGAERLAGGQNDSYGTNEDVRRSHGREPRRLLSNDTDIDSIADGGSGDGPGARHADPQLRRQLHLHADCRLQRPDSFTYKANDGSADSNVATVTINVAAVNDAPVARNDTLQHERGYGAHGDGARPARQRYDIDSATLTALLK